MNDEVEKDVRRTCSRCWSDSAGGDKTSYESAVDAIIHGTDRRFQQLTGLHEAFAFLLDATSLMSYDDSNSDVQGAELLQMRIQTTLTGIVSWTRYKTAEYSSVDVQQLSRHHSVYYNSLSHFTKVMCFLI